MIPSFVIKKYLNRPLDDHQWMKRLTHEELDDMIADLRPRPKFGAKLRAHQKVGFLLGVSYESFSYWLDMGSGKTLLSLELFDYWRLCGVAKRMLVGVLSDKAFPTWEQQTAEYKPHLKCIALEGSSADKWDTLEHFRDGIGLVSYPGAVAMCHYQTPSGKWKLSKEHRQQLADKTDVLTMDESTYLGNMKSMSNLLFSYIARRVDHRYALAGLPFGRDPDMLYSQQKIIDKGESFVTKALFQEALFIKEKNQWSRSKYAFNYHFNKARELDLGRMMQHRSITYEEHECTDVPKMTKIRVPVRIDADIEAYYNQGIKELRKARGDFEATKNIFLRLRQITSGFIGLTNDETGEKIKLEFPRNPKLETLMDKIASLREDRKAVIFYDYTFSGRKITSELGFIKGFKHIWLWSGTKNTRASLNQFYTDPKCRFAVINNQVGAFSLDGLQKVANYMFFYESPVPVIRRKQAEKRIKRPGQPRKVYAYDLVVPGSVDERILDFHKEGTDLMKAVRRNPELLELNGGHDED